MDLETIYRLYFRDVYRYVRALSQNEHLAEKIAQETFARALRAVDRFDGRGERGCSPSPRTPGWTTAAGTGGRQSCRGRTCPAAGIFLTCFWGRRVAAGEVEVRMRVAATDPVTWETRPATAADFAQGACQYVVQFQLESGDPLRGRTERFVETDEDGTVTLAGLVVDLWEVLPVTSGSGNYGTGFTETVGAVSEDFDFVCIVRYRDGAVTYSAREMGLLEPAG